MGISWGLSGLLLIYIVNLDLRKGFISVHLLSNVLLNDILRIIPSQG